MNFEKCSIRKPTSPWITLKGRVRVTNERSLQGATYMYICTVHVYIKPMAHCSGASQKIMCFANFSKYWWFQTKLFTRLLESHILKPLIENFLFHCLPKLYFGFNCGNFPFNLHFVLILPSPALPEGKTKIERKREGGGDSFHPIFWRMKEEREERGTVWCNVGVCLFVCLFVSCLFLLLFSWMPSFQKFYKRTCTVEETDTH